MSSTVSTPRGNATTKGIARGQSPAAQAARLERGLCPMHGLFMSQVSGWGRDLQGRQVTLVQCPRRDCGIRATALKDWSIATVYQPGEDVEGMDEDDWQRLQLRRQITQLQQLIVQLQAENAALRAELLASDSSGGEESE